MHAQLGKEESSSFVYEYKLVQHNKTDLKQHIGSRPPQKNHFIIRWRLNLEVDSILKSTWNDSIYFLNIIYGFILPDSRLHFNVKKNYVCCKNVCSNSLKPLSLTTFFICLVHITIQTIPPEYILTPTLFLIKYLVTPFLGVWQKSQWKLRLSFCCLVIYRK